MGYLGYEYHDGGRRNAGYKGSAGDCVVRAISIITGTPYKTVYTDMAAAMKANGYRNSGDANTVDRGIKRTRGMKKVRDVQNSVKVQYGLERVKIPKGPRPTYAEAYDRYGNCIVGTVKHVSAIVDGVLLDTFDSRTYRMKDADGNINTHERKAQNIFIPKK